MKKLLVCLMLLFTGACYATTSEIFDGMDKNAVKAGLSKHILTKGGKVDHGESYENDTYGAIERVNTKNGSYALHYIFNLVSLENGTRLDLTVLKSDGGRPNYIDPAEEQEIMEKIKTALKGRFLYGLGFEFQMYDTPSGKIKAPKGKETGIVLTAVKYDALKKGLKVGDVITEINGVPLKKIPIKQFSTILFAQNLTDTITLTVNRNKETFTVTLQPRVSNTKVF